MITALLVLIALLLLRLAYIGAVLCRSLVAMNSQSVSNTQSIIRALKLNREKA